MERDSALNLAFFPPVTLFAFRASRRGGDAFTGTAAGHIGFDVRFAATDDPPTLRPLDTAPRTDIRVQDEDPDHPDPTPVAGQRLVEVGRDVVQLVQARPRDGGEVMVLVVQADVIREDVERAVVGVCLGGLEGLERVRRVGLRLRFELQLGERFGAAGGHFGEEVVLGDEVAGAGVQGSGQE